jgi:hypothetical protein
VVRAVAQAQTTLIDTQGVDHFAAVLARESRVALVVMTRLAVTYEMMPEAPVPGRIDPERVQDLVETTREVATVLCCLATHRPSTCYASASWRRPSAAYPGAPFFWPLLLGHGPG